MGALFSTTKMKAPATATGSSPPITIAIIGSGIGGLALAIGLNKQDNVQYIILESAPRFDAVGAGIGLGPNALRAMELMDSKFRSMYDKIKVGNTDPKRLNEQFEILGAEEGFRYGGSVGGEGFERSSAHRKALLEVMQSLVPASSVRFGRRVVGVKQEDGERVKLEFADGEKMEVDAVIGCDGIKGMTRRVVLGSRWPEEVPAKYANTYVYRGIAPMNEAKKIIGSYAEDAKWFMKEGRGCAMYPISKGTELNMVAFMKDENPWDGEQSARDCSREEMVAEFAQFDHRLRKLLTDVSYRVTQSISFSNF
jgi:salicylate hydroxylase